SLVSGVAMKICLSVLGPTFDLYGTGTSKSFFLAQRGEQGDSLHRCSVWVRLESENMKKHGKNDLSPKEIGLKKPGVQCNENGPRDVNAVECGSDQMNYDVAKLGTGFAAARVFPCNHGL